MALAELETALSPAGPPSALVAAAARLRGDLAAAAGHHAAAAAAFETAWRRAQGLRMPLALAQLEISDAAAPGARTRRDSTANGGRPPARAAPGVTARLPVRRPQ